MKTIPTTKPLAGAIFVALTFSLLVSCGGGSKDDTVVIPPIDITGAVALGYGTDIFGTYASSDNIKAPVLDLQALNTQGMLAIDRNVEEATFISTSGTTISEYASSLGVSVGVSGQYKFFTASIDTRFESEFYSSEEFAFATVQELYKKTALKIGEQYRGTALRNFLLPEAAHALATWTPEQILAAYGTHVMVGIYEGARLDYSMALQITEEMLSRGVSVYASAGFKMAFNSAQLDTGVDTTEMERVRQSIRNTHVEAKGGQSQFAHCDDTNNPAICDAARAAWLNSIDQNPVFCAIMHDGLVPIWEFAADPAQRAAIESHYRAYGIGKHVQYPFPRYEEIGRTVTDHHWGLMWAQKLDGAHDDVMHASNTRFSWEFAEYWVSSTVNPLRHAGYSNWRIPAFEELWTLVDHSRAPAALVDTRFGLIDGVYWSSTDFEDDPARATALWLSSSLRNAAPTPWSRSEENRGSLILVRDAY